MNDLEKKLEQMSGTYGNYEDPQPATPDGWDQTERELGIPPEEHNPPGRTQISAGHIALNPQVVDRPPTLEN